MNVKGKRIGPIEIVETGVYSPRYSNNINPLWLLSGKIYWRILSNVDYHDNIVTVPAGFRVWIVFNGSKRSHVDRIIRLFVT